MLRRRGRRGTATAAGAARGARRRARADDTGSGAAIGMAMMFPLLILVIISISMLSGSGLIDQTLQSTADRAARTAALCCRYVGGPNGAGEVARAALAAAEDAAAANRVRCNNDFIGDSRVVFLNLEGDLVFALSFALSGHAIAVSDRDGKPVPYSEFDKTAVPLGGTVHIHLTCQVPPDDARLGGFELPVTPSRSVEGVAVIEPYRPRS